MWFRMLGVGAVASIAALTIALAVTGRLGLYINPESSWFAVSMAVLALVGSVLSFLLPLGAAEDHGHDHGDAPAADAAHDHDHHDHAPRTSRQLVGTAATVAGGVLALGVATTMLVVPPATLSAELAASRNTGAPPLFQGSDTVALAITGDTASFGIGDWASVFATATDPEVFDGTEISLTGFVAPGEGGFDLTRLIITHCVIDAQPASLPVTADDIPDDGQWVTVTGTIRDVNGQLQVAAATVKPIAEPKDPYEF
ncbi:TIGR03943 family putative permease subunit [Microbacterium aquilitoris]|uniref:TIGR03943 family putative permease subunit n=1 Tax=Microbacterium aquilitoris TaxID=3067307 RepID=UPI00288EF7DF|nr:TIGR03943 family protein [Microbacterium sp. KSW2-22]MDT3345128.1 TIGR03943 family protein [Microbacterium sp. KSW2-22]